MGIKNDQDIVGIHGLIMFNILNKKKTWLVNTNVDGSRKYVEMTIEKKKIEEKHMTYQMGYHGPKKSKPSLSLTLLGVGLLVFCLRCLTLIDHCFWVNYNISLT